MNTKCLWRWRVAGHHSSLGCIGQSVLYSHVLMPEELVEQNQISEIYVHKQTLPIYPNYMQLAFHKLDSAANNLSVNRDAHRISSANFLSEMHQWMLCRWIWVDPNIRQINAAMLRDSSLLYQSGIHSQVDYIHPNHTACSNLCKVILIQIHRSSRNTDVSHLILEKFSCLLRKAPHLDASCADMEAVANITMLAKSNLQLQKSISVCTLDTHSSPRISGHCTNLEVSTLGFTPQISVHYYRNWTHASWRSGCMWQPWIQLL